MKKTAAFITSLILSTSSIAAEWVELFNEGEFKILLDVGSVKDVPNNPYNYKKAWLKNIVVNDTTKDGLTVNDFVMTLVYVDCESLKYGFKAAYAYKNLKQMSNETRAIPIMEDVIPETKASTIVDSVCYAYKKLNENQ
ncbi:hypothetical protein [Acinetobacter baumannii]|uniref:hypothetical protein n=1 Tax=Acinetobacter baumannii TaxID=470 RepID=UPI000A3922B8|nr:hypothetical protein [Acinetobacter baumannii]MBT8177298.1 hypothetical protein [Acinetobacter baumannii]OTT28132.1 hypothetical protein CAS81_11030 [Acinetobacter baumannii]TPS15774.1 hypothetical protein FJV06_01530 [Acinetobacter baumannii]HDI2995381.1 hypothetical protein [Acinetobacter baumannii]HDI5575640.1 hypothetical protein [Acinetobacter baumannii]